MLYWVKKSNKEELCLNPENSCDTSLLDPVKQYWFLVSGNKSASCLSSFLNNKIQKTWEGRTTPGTSFDTLFLKRFLMSHHLILFLDETIKLADLNQLVVQETKLHKKEVAYYFSYKGEVFMPSLDFPSQAVPCLWWLVAGDSILLHEPLLPDQLVCVTCSGKVNTKLLLWSTLQAGRNVKQKTASL